MDGIEAIIANTPEKDITGFAQGLIDKKLQKDKRLAQELGRHWEEILPGTFRWDRMQVEAAALKKVDKAAVLDFFRRYMAPASPERRVLAMRVDGSAKGASAQGEREVAIPADLRKLRGAMDLLPERGFY